jgi:hypothetical protein
MRMDVKKSALARLMGLHGELQVEFIRSAALENNALGDSPTRPIAVYLPPGYDPNGSARYPVLYCLHGYTGDAAALLSTRPWETNVVQWMDRLIAGQRMPSAILAIVDGFTRLGGSQYVNSIHNGDYETYVLRDVIGHVDKRFRTVGRFRRAVLEHAAPRRLCGICIAQRRLVLQVRASAGICRHAAHAGEVRLEYRALRRSV